MTKSKMFSIIFAFIFGLIALISGVFISISLPSPVTLDCPSDASNEFDDANIMPSDPKDASATWLENADSLSHNITSAQELAALAYAVNVDGYNTTDEEFYLEADIDLSDYFWIPIGTQDNPFRGTFIGNGYTISYLYIINDGFFEQEELGCAGLFGVIENARIEYLAVTHLKAGGYYFDENLHFSFEYVGGIAGYVTGFDSRIDNCIVMYAQMYPNSYGGGIVGASDCSNLYIRECYFVDGIIFNDFGGEACGGIIGFNSASITLDWCQVLVENFITEIRAGGAAGGIIGQAEEPVEINYCEVDGVFIDGYRAGGICGSANALVWVSDCQVKGNVNGWIYAAGIAVNADSVSDCSVDAHISCSTSSTSTSNFYGAAGIAWNANTIKNCIVKGTISTNKAQYKAGIAIKCKTVSNCQNYATGAAAGIVYELQQNGSVKNCINYAATSYVGIAHTVLANGKIENCQNRGKVSYAGIAYSITSGTIQNCVNFGQTSYGIVNNATKSLITNCINRGQCNSAGIAYTVSSASTIDNCVNYGKISDGRAGIVAEVNSSDVMFCINQGDVSSSDGTDGTGGIAGETSNSNIINCSNSGAITLIDDSHGFLGGVVGIVAGGVIEKCLNTGDIRVENVLSIFDKIVYAGGIAGVANMDAQILDSFAYCNANIPMCYDLGSESFGMSGIVGAVGGDTLQIVGCGAKIIVPDLADYSVVNCAYDESLRYLFFAHAVYEVSDSRAIVDSSYVVFADADNNGFAVQSTEMDTAYDQHFLDALELYDGMPIPLGISWMADSFGWVIGYPDADYIFTGIHGYEKFEYDSFA